MMAIIMQLSGPPEAKKWCGGTAMSEEVLFDDIEIFDSDENGVVMPPFDWCTSRKTRNLIY